MKFKKTMSAAMLCAAVSLAACGGKEDAGEKTTVSAGEEVYQQSCLSCHGENLEGAFGPALDNIGSKYSEEEILHIIHEGQGSMPANVVEGEEAEAVAAWLAEKKK